MAVTRRDVIATVLVAAVVVPYLGYLVRGEMPFIHDARGMAALALGLGLAAGVTGGMPVRGSGLAWLGAVLSVGTLALGVAAMVLRDDYLLGGTVAGVVVLWVMTTTRHALSRAEEHAPRKPERVAAQRPDRS